MSEAKPVSRCSVSKDGVMTGLEDTLLDHAIKMEEVDLEPDYIECDTDVDTEMTAKDEQTDNCDLIQDIPNNSTYSDTVDLNDDKQTIASFNHYMDIERRRLDANVPTNIGRRKKIISQHDNSHSQTCQDIQITEVKSEIGTNANEISNDLNIIHESGADRGEYLTGHSGEKLLTCNYCGYKSNHKEHMKQHIRTHTGEKPFSCEICNFKCARKGTLTRHTRTHTGEKPYSCNLCDYKCKEKSSIRVHMRTHTGERPYSCDMCNFKCSKKESLTVHFRTHTGENPYSCNVCDFKCYRKGTLNYHLRAHHGEKPFSCDVCYFKCGNKGALTLHLKTHTGEQPYSCDVCNIKCAQIGNLEHHMRIHTGENRS